MFAYSDWVKLNPDRLRKIHSLSKHVMFQCAGLEINENPALNVISYI